MQFVYVAKDQVTDREVALKTPKNDSAQKRFRRSAIVAAKVNHPNVAKTLDYIDENERTFLVEELILGEDMKRALLTKTDHVDPYLVAKIFHHLSKGVAAAHHNEVVHRDLKPTNIMIVGGYNLDELKLTDFGIAKMAEVELEEGLESEESLIASATALGAIPYMAPEAIEAPETVGLPADIWSVGAIMLHVLYGNYPFGSGLKAVSRITKDELPKVPDFVLENSQFEPLAKEIIEIAHSCLQKDPAQRPTADELVMKCNLLCYTVSGRKVGSIKNYFYNDAWGFIRTAGEDVFFHKDCVFGDKPKVNDKVIFSSYDGGQAQRALPVLKLK